MLHGLRLKFQQHDLLRHFLLQTGTAVLIYDTERDEYWGYGIAGSGRNRLGGLLMSVRKELHELSRVEWDYKQRESRHNCGTSPPTMHATRTMTFAENPRDLLDRLECPRNLINPILACSIYRYTPVHTRPALTNQQSFYDSHTSPPYQSPKSSYKPTLEHQESFVAPQSSGLNTFGFMPMRQMLERTSSK